MKKLQQQEEGVSVPLANSKQEVINELDAMLTVEDIQNHLHIGKNSAYALVKLSSFPSIKIGRTYLVPLSEYKKWLTKSIGKEYCIK